MGKVNKIDLRVVSMALILLAITALVICILCFNASNNRREIMLDGLKQQKEEVQKERRNHERTWRI